MTTSETKVNITIYCNYNDYIGTIVEYRYNDIYKIFMHNIYKYIFFHKFVGFLLVQLYEYHIYFTVYVDIYYFNI